MFNPMTGANNFVGNSKSSNPEPDKQVDAITADLIGFIERSEDRPFFAYFAHHAPHTPMEAPCVLVERHRRH